MHMGKLRVGVSLGVIVGVVATAVAMAQDNSQARDQQNKARRAQAQPTAAQLQARQESLIELRFAEDENLSGRSLDARVQGDTTTLTGTVKTEADRERAERLAVAAGASKVDNQVQVEPPPAKPAKGSNEPMTVEERQRQRAAQSDPYRRDPLVGAMPTESTPLRETRLRSMGMQDPKQVKEQQAQGQQAQPSSTGGSNTMAPVAAPPANSDRPETGNQSNPPADPTQSR
jgi:hypothetical protein